MAYRAAAAGGEWSHGCCCAAAVCSSCGCWPSSCRCSCPACCTSCCCAAWLCCPDSDCCPHRCCSDSTCCSRRCCARASCRLVGSGPCASTSLLVRRNQCSRPPKSWEESSSLRQNRAQIQGQVASAWPTPLPAPALADHASSRTQQCTCGGAADGSMERAAHLQQRWMASMLLIPPSTEPLKLQSPRRHVNSAK